MPELKFNGESRRCEEGTSVEALLRQLGVEPSGMIVVMNGEVLEAQGLASRILKEGDALDLLRVAGGG